jgi:hypothetical protein
MSGPSSEPKPAMPIDPDPAWGPIARIAGIFAGIAFFVATIAFLVEATGLLAEQPTYVRTAAGQIADDAAFYVTALAYQKAVLWDYVLRDGLYFFAYLALIPLGLALRELTGPRRAAQQLAAAFLFVAAIFGCMNAFQTFIPLGYWRGTGWEEVPATTMVTIGRVLNVVEGMTKWDSIASNITLAIAMVFVGRVIRDSGFAPKWLGSFAWLGAAVLASLAVSSVIPGTNVVYDLLALVIGVLIAPVLSAALGIFLARAPDRLTAT